MEYKEIKTIVVNVCLSKEQYGYLADKDKLARYFCNKLNEIQSAQMEKGYCYLHYEPVVNDLNIPLHQVEEIIVDARGRTIGVVYND